MRECVNGNAWRSLVVEAREKMRRYGEKKEEEKREGKKNKIKLK